MKVTITKGPLFEKKEIEAYQFLQKVIKKQIELEEKENGKETRSA